MYIFFAAGSQVSLHIGVLWQTLPAHAFDHNPLRRSVNPHENIEDLQHKKHDAHLTEIMNRPSKYAKTEGQADCIVNSLACLVVTLWVHFLSPDVPKSGGLTKAHCAGDYGNCPCWDCRLSSCRLLATALTF